jgi:regulator of replication initiation timing
MNDSQISKYDQLRSELLMILEQTDGDYSHLVKQLDELLADHERLQKEVSKLRSALPVKNSSYMSSKLRDALRE